MQLRLEPALSGLARSRRWRRRSSRARLRSRRPPLPPRPASPRKAARTGRYPARVQAAMAVRAFPSSRSHGRPSRSPRPAREICRRPRTSAFHARAPSSTTSFTMAPRRDAIRGASFRTRRSENAHKRWCRRGRFRPRAPSSPRRFSRPIDLAQRPESKAR